MKRFLLILSLMFVAAAAFGIPCPTTYAYDYLQTIAAQSSLSADQSNVPWLFMGAGVLATPANGGFSLSSGADIVPCTADSGGTIIPFERINYSATTGTAEFHILAPTISKTTAQTIYWKIGKSSAVDYSNPFTVTCSATAGTFTVGETATQATSGDTAVVLSNSPFIINQLSGTTSDATHVWTGGTSGATCTASSKPSSNMWTSYLGVWHHGTSSTLALTDSTMQTTATNHGATATASQINGGMTFSSTNYDDTGSTQTGLTNFTLESWVKPNFGTGGASYFPLSSRNSGTTGGIFLLCVSTTTNTSGYCSIGYSNGAALAYTHGANDSALNTTAYYFAGTHVAGASNSVTFYQNGVAGGTTATSGTATDPANSSTTLQFGRDGADSTPYNATGFVIDEERLSNVVRSADYVKAEYIVQSNPTATYTFLPNRSAQVFYLSTSGSDSNTCTSGSPCLTLAHVCPQIALPGDGVTQTGGGSFTGPCTFGAGASGTLASPITVTQLNIAAANGNTFNTTTPPYISSGAADCLDMTDSEYVTISGLTCTGNAWTGSFPSITVNNFGVGIQDYNTRTTGNPLRNVIVTGSTFIYMGLGMNINARGSASAVGFNNLQITNNTFNHILSWGIVASGYNAGNAGNLNQITSGYIAGNTFNDIPGNPNGGSNGAPAVASEAIQLGSCTGCTIERNYVNEGGYTAGNTLSVGGCSIVATNSRNILMQYNEVTGTSMVHNYDGCAFDLDQDTQNSTVQYNLSYNNPGPFFQMGSFGGKTTQNNFIHDNISINDVRGYSSTSNQPAMSIWGSTANNYFHNNSIYIGTGHVAGSTPSCGGFIIAGSNVSDVFANNICKVASGIPMWYSSGAYSTTPAFIGNVYDASGGMLVLSSFNSSTTSTLAAFQALGSGYENQSGVNYGTVGSANWLNLAGFSAPSGGWIANGGISTMHNIDLTASSTAIGAGVDTGFLGQVLAPVDYHRSFRRTAISVDAGAVAYIQQSSGTGAGSITIY